MGDGVARRFAGRRTLAGGQFYIAPDHLGAPHLITGAGGVAVWLWNHDPFGNGDSLGATYELRFPGQFFDQATRLHYNYFRDYDPRTGRYIESDPIGLAGGINTYAYVGGNPISQIDPDGEDWRKWARICYSFFCWKRFPERPPPPKPEPPCISLPIDER